jgi:electron transport complex protein RnfE
VLVVLGGIREVLGYGTLLTGADLLLGEWAKSLTIVVFETDSPFLLAILPPGAFLGMGLLIALKNMIDKRIEQRKASKQEAKVVQRARVTGTDI